MKNILKALKVLSLIPFLSSAAYGAAAQTGSGVGMIYNPDKDSYTICYENPEIYWASLNLSAEITTAAILAGIEKPIPEGPYQFPGVRPSQPATPEGPYQFPGVRPSQPATTAPTVTPGVGATCVTYGSYLAAMLAIFGLQSVLNTSEMEAEINRLRELYPTNPLFKYRADLNCRDLKEKLYGLIDTIVYRCNQNFPNDAAKRKKCISTQYCRELVIPVKEKQTPEGPRLVYPEDRPNNPRPVQQPTTPEDVPKKLGLDPLNKCKYYNLNPRATDIPRIEQKVCLRYGTIFVHEFYTTYGCLEWGVVYHDGAACVQYYQEPKPIGGGR